MKWFTHQAVAVGAGLCIGLPVSGLVGALAGAVLPDVLDQRMAGLLSNRQKAFNRIHRGSTHWFGWWLGVAALAALPAMPPALRGFCLGLGFGGLMHVLLDLCTVRGGAALALGRPTPAGPAPVPHRRPWRIPVLACRLRLVRLPATRAAAATAGQGATGSGRIIRRPFRD